MPASCPSGHPRTGKSRALRLGYLLSNNAIQNRYQCRPSVLDGRAAIQEMLYLVGNRPGRQELGYVASGHPPNRTNQQSGLNIFSHF